MQPTLSVIIVNYRVKWFLAQTLDAVSQALKGISHEVWVVDNNSGDDSISYARSLFPDMNFIENSDNPGFAKANNQAIKLAAGKYTLILNPDTIITREAITAAISYLDANPQCGAAGTKMIDGNGVFLPESKRSFPTPFVSFCKIFGLSRLFPKSRIFGRYALQYLNPDEIHKVDILAGAYIVARTNILQEIGGFDESFFMYGEDIDLSYRITREGYYNVYLPSPIIHYKGESTHKGDFRYVESFYNAMLIFFRKHYPHISTPFAFAIKTGIAVRAALAYMRRCIPIAAPRHTAITVSEAELTILDTATLSYSEIVNRIAANPRGCNYAIRSGICGGKLITPKMPQL